MNNTLKPLGPCAETWDYAAYEYGKYFIVLHHTIYKHTRLRLITDRDCPIFFQVFCDWCCGREGIITRALIVGSVCIMMRHIDADTVKKLPHGSEPRPLHNDPKFMKWWGQECEKIPKQELSDIDILLSDVINKNLSI